MADLRTKIGALELKNPVMTASGTFGYGLEFADFVASLTDRRNYRQGNDPRTPAGQPLSPNGGNSPGNVELRRPAE